MKEIYNYYDDSLKFRESLFGTYVIETYTGKAALSGVIAVSMAIGIIEHQLELEKSTGEQRFSENDVNRLKKITAAFDEICFD